MRQRRKNRILPSNFPSRICFSFRREEKLKKVRYHICLVTPSRNLISSLPFLAVTFAMQKPPYPPLALHRRLQEKEGGLFIPPPHAYNPERERVANPWPA